MRAAPGFPQEQGRPPGSLGGAREAGFWGGWPGAGRPRCPVKGLREETPTRASRDSGDPVPPGSRAISSAAGQLGRDAAARASSLGRFLSIPPKLKFFQERPEGRQNPAPSGRSRVQCGRGASGAASEGRCCPLASARPRRRPPAAPPEAPRGSWDPGSSLAPSMALASDWQARWQSLMGVRGGSPPTAHLLGEGRGEDLQGPGGPISRELKLRAPRGRWGGRAPGAPYLEVRDPAGEGGTLSAGDNAPGRVPLNYAQMPAAPGPEGSSRPRAKLGWVRHPGRARRGWGE